MAKVSEALITSIKKLGESPAVYNQRKACDELCGKIFPDSKCIDPSVIPQVLPLLVKMLKSGDSLVQREAAFFITVITLTKHGRKNEEDYTKYVTDAGAVQNLVKLLSTNDQSVLGQALRCLVNIAYYFPQDLVQNNALPSLIECLKSDNECISLPACQCLNSISSDRQNVTAVIEAEGVVPLIKLLESKCRKTCEQSLDALTNIVSYDQESCQYVLAHGALMAIKKLFVRLSTIKVLAVSFIEKVTSFDEIPIDEVIDENIIPMIVKQIKNGVTEEIAMKSVQVISNIIEKKLEYIPTLINNNNYISVICGNFESSNIEFLVAILSTLNDIIHSNGHEEIVRQKFLRFRGPRKMRPLLTHVDERVRKLSNTIIESVDNHAAQQQERSPDGRSVEPNSSGEEPAVEAQSGRKKRKIPQHFTRNKKSKTSLDQTDTEPSVSPHGDDDHNYDFNDAHSSNHSPVNSSNVTTPNSTNPNNLSQRQSSVNPGDEATGETTRNNVNNFSRSLFSAHSDLPEETSPSAVFRNLPRKQSPPFIEPPRIPSTTNNLPGNDMSNNNIPASTIDPPRPTSSANNIPQNNNTFEIIEYSCLPDFFLKECCKKLGVTFDKKKYFELLPKIDFDAITSNSKPATYLPMNNYSGFSCFSIFLTGDEGHTEKIEKQIRGKTIDEIPENIFDKEKVKKIALFPALIDEHIKTICQWFKCRIMVYCNGEGWQQFGDSEDGNYVPIFVLEKKALGDSFVYEIVLTLKDD